MRVGAAATLLSKAPPRARLERWCGGLALAVLGSTMGCTTSAAPSLEEAPAISSLVVGRDFTALVDDDGQVYLWGEGRSGVLGNGETAVCGEAGANFCGRGPRCCVGDDELPAGNNRVQVGDEVVALVMGWNYACALLSDEQSTLCWGEGAEGTLGLAAPRIGDDELAADGPLHRWPSRVVEMVAGAGHTCVRLESGDLHCFGRSDLGQLGYGDREVRGDADASELAESIPLPFTPTRAWAGAFNTCATSAEGAILCWGDNQYLQADPSATTFGEVAIGDDESLADRSPIDLGDFGPVEEVAIADTLICALNHEGRVRCWGTPNRDGAPGDASYNGGPSGVDVPLPLGAQQVAVDVAFSYALLDDGRIALWSQDNDEEVEYIEPPEPVAELQAGFSHGCILGESGMLYCWGYGDSGALGYGNRESLWPNDEGFTWRPVEWWAEPSAVD